MKTILAIVSILVFGVVSASALTINFDDLEVSGTSPGYLTSYNDQGFQFTGQDFMYWQQEHAYYNTSAALFIRYQSNTARLSAVDGSLFTLNSIDLDTLYNRDTDTTVTFTGYNSANQVVATESLTWRADGWITLDFTPEFNNLAYVDWIQTFGYHHFDNVVINGDSTPAPVPEPATMLLLGTGLAGLGLIRNKRKA